MDVLESVNLESVSLESDRITLGNEMNNNEISNNENQNGDRANGENLTIETAITNLRGDDLGLRFYAAWWLGRFRVQNSEAVQELIKALEDEDDRTNEGGYPLRRNAARALGKMGDLSAIPGLTAALLCSDFYVREAAAESLGMLGDKSAIPELGKLLAQGIANGGLVQPQPDNRQPYDAILEALGSLQAVELGSQIELFLQHPTPRVQYAAARAMYQLTAIAKYGDILIRALEGDDLQLRRAALTDLGAIGYLAAAEPIAQTLAENSLKLIALKGILEHEVKKVSPLTPTLTVDVIRVMTLMDSLL